eukprot:scaffold10481_cov68-Cyclotella_meneghiniana.AAC.6
MSASSGNQKWNIATFDVRLAASIPLSKYIFGLIDDDTFLKSIHQVCADFGKETEMIDREALVVNPIYNMVSMVLKLNGKEKILNMADVCDQSGWMTREEAISE